MSLPKNMCMYRLHTNIHLECIDTANSVWPGSLNHPQQVHISVVYIVDNGALLRQSFYVRIQSYDREWQRKRRKNATSSLARFENSNIFFLKNALAYFILPL
jgi:hypothetical protein